MKQLVLWMMLCVVLAGCDSPAWGDWDGRVGTYTYNQAMHDLGRPKASMILRDGSIEAQWLVQKGQVGPANYYGMESSFGSPGSVGSLIAFQTYPAANRYLRLTFDSNGRLVKWKRFYA